MEICSKIKKSSILGTALLCLTFLNPLVAYDWGYDHGSSLEVDQWNACGVFTAGYRDDQINTKVKGLDADLGYVISDGLKAHLCLAEIGFKGRLTVLKSWFIQGYAMYGSTLGGKAHEKTKAKIACEALTRTKSHIRRGHVDDFNISVGCFVGPKNFRFAPKVGWSWDNQFYQVGKATTNHVQDCVLSYLSYKDRWEGPWVGFETYYTWFDAEFGIGYEYHRPKWHGKWSLRGSDVQSGAFSDKRHANKAYGNCISFNTNYRLREHFSVGLDFKYQVWRVTKKGKEKPEGSADDFADIGQLKPENDELVHAGWKSVGIKLDFRVCF
jgi:hypothetical protein